MPCECNFFGQEFRPLESSPQQRRTYRNREQHRHRKKSDDGSVSHGKPLKCAMGRTKGGINSKVHAVVDGQGRAIALLLSPGQAHEVTIAPELLKQLRRVVILGDKASDSYALYEKLRAQECRVSIPTRRRRRKVPFHRGWYRKRHRVENFFQRAKCLRRFATRYDKTSTCFFATACLTAVLDWLNRF